MERGGETRREGKGGEERGEGRGEGRGGVRGEGRGEGRGEIELHVMIACIK